MDPLITPIAIGIISLITGLVAGRASGKRSGRRNPTGLENENRILIRDNTDMARTVEWEKGLAVRLQGDVDQARAQRDQYKKLATTQNVKMPKATKPKASWVPIWKGRRYCGHPSMNLENLAKEMKQYEGREVKLTVTVKGTGQFGAWSSILKKNWSSTDRHGRKTRMDEIGPFDYNGPAERALADFKTQILDDDTGLMVRDKPAKKGAKADGKKVWADTDSPLLFLVNLQVVSKPQAQKPPQVQVVKVAVVEREVERVIEERPIFVSVPEGQEADLCGHTKEEIRDMVKDVVAREKARDEVEALGRLVSTPEDEAERKLQQQRKVAHMAAQRNRSG